MISSTMAILYETRKGHRSHTTRDYYEKEPPKRDLQAHDAPKDERSIIHRASKGAQDLYEIVTLEGREYKLPRHIRDEPSYQMLLEAIGKGDRSAEKKFLKGVKRLPRHPDLSKARGMSSNERAEVYAKGLDDYVSREMQCTIAKQKRPSPVMLDKNHRVVDTSTGKHVSKYRQSRYESQKYEQGHHPAYKLAAAVIGVAILLLLGTSFLTGQITGSFVSELENSPQFSYTILVSLLVIFLFGMIWQHSKKPLEIK